MRRIRFTLAAAGLASAALASAALAGPPTQGAARPVQYEMTGDYAFGCFSICRCPIALIDGLSGSFTLTETSPPGGLGGVLRTFDVTDFHLASPAGTGTAITGSGTYQIFSEFAIIQSMELDLSINGGDVQHFHSGGSSGASFPDIDLSLTIHDLEACFDQLVSFSAAPAPADDQPPAADLNGDGDVDGLDLALLLAQWGNCPLDCICCCIADFNCDSTTDGLDIAILLAAWAP